jgi:hypothetical protein
MTALAGTVIGVVGGSGGVGASTFAAVLAARARGAMLVDLDGVGGGIDVLLGIEATAGARWSQLQTDGGRLDPDLLARGLPRWGGVPVLAADAGPPPAHAVPTVLAAAAAAGPAVLDLPRGPCPERAAALRDCALVVLLAQGSVRGVAAARAVAVGLSEVRCGLVLRRGLVGAAEAGRLVGVPLMGLVPRLRAPGDQLLNPRRPPVGLARVAAGILDGLMLDGSAVDVRTVGALAGRAS